MAKIKISVALDILPIRLRSSGADAITHVGVPIGSTGAVIPRALPCNREFRAEYERRQIYV